MEIIMNRNTFKIIAILRTQEGVALQEGRVSLGNLIH